MRYSILHHGRHGYIIFLYTCIHFKHVIRTDFVRDLPVLTLEVLPGMINCLQLLQNSCLNEYGMLTRLCKAILSATRACFSAQSLSLPSSCSKFLSKISILSLAMALLLFLFN